MSFDALLSLLAVIFFIVLPLISNANKRRAQGSKPKPPPGPAQSPQPPAAGEPPSGWLARLEEARQRVEAEFEAGSASTEARTTTATAVPRPVPTARPMPAVPQARTDRTPPVPRVRPQRAARADASPAFAERSDDLQITRLGTGPAYNNGRSARSASTLTSRSSVLNGIIWHQILSEPLYLQRTGRKTSRLRSP